jgi:MFS transporter, DHA1 family, tetracycline resistance protein
LQADNAPVVKATRASMGFIMVTVLIDMIAIGLIVPVLPGIVGQFTSSASEQTLWFGAVNLAFGIASFVSAPVLGALSDAYGRRPVLLLGFAGLMLSFFVTAMATTLWVLIAVRLVSGAMQANAAVANAYVADITAPEDRARRFGLLGAMFGVGFTLGPALGGLLGDIDVRWPFWVAGSMALVNAVYGYWVLPESLQPHQRKAFVLREVHPFAAVKRLFGLSAIGTLPWVVAFSALAQFSLYTTWVLYTGFKFGWGPSQVGWSLFAVGVMQVLVQGFLLKHMLRRFTSQTLVVGGLLCSAATYLGYGLVPEGWMIFVVIAVGNLFSAGVMAAIQGTISSAASAQEQGQTMGSVSAVNTLMAAIAPVLATPLLGAVAHLPRSDVMLGLPFFACALLQLISAALAWRFFVANRAVAMSAPKVTQSAH